MAGPVKPLRHRREPEGSGFAADRGERGRDNGRALEAARVDPRQFLEKLRALGFGFFSVTDQGGLEPLQEEALWTGTKITNMVLLRS